MDLRARLVRPKPRSRPISAGYVETVSGNPPIASWRPGTPMPPLALDPGRARMSAGRAVVTDVPRQVRDTTRLPRGVRGIGDHESTDHLCEAADKSSQKCTR
jgi:hypothetical protein